MSNIYARSARIGFLTLAAAMIATVGLAGDAAARHRIHTAHFHRLNSGERNMSKASRFKRTRGQP
jgi:hypothetical protein